MSRLLDEYAHTLSASRVDIEKVSSAFWPFEMVPHSPPDRLTPAWYMLEMYQAGVLDRGPIVPYHVQLLWHIQRTRGRLQELAMLHHVELMSDLAFAQTIDAYEEPNLLLPNDPEHERDLKAMTFSETVINAGCVVGAVRRMFDSKPGHALQIIRDDVWGKEDYAHHFQVEMAVVMCIGDRLYRLLTANRS